MPDTFEVIVHYQGEIKLEATLAREDVPDALAPYAPTINGEKMKPERMMVLARLAEGFWTYQDLGVMVKPSSMIIP